MLAGAMGTAVGLLNECRDVTVKAFYVPILDTLHGYHLLECWVEEPEADMPEFSLSHTSHIGKVGDHVLTLIRNIEMETSEDLYNEAYVLEFLVLPTATLHHSINTHYWLSLISNSILSVLITKITQIKSLTRLGARQLAADLQYFLQIIKTLQIGEGVNYVETLEAYKDALKG
jgi:hypothetical protein